MLRIFIKILTCAAVVMLITVGSYMLLSTDDRTITSAVNYNDNDVQYDETAISGRLVTLGYLSERAEREEYKNALSHFQLDNSLTVSGSANAETRGALGCPFTVEETVNYEGDRFLASVVDCLCDKTTFLTKVAVAGVLLRGQEEGNRAAVINAAFGGISGKRLSDYDFRSEPSEVALRAVHEAREGMSPCPEAVAFYRSDLDSSGLSTRPILYKSGKYVFVA